MELKFCCRIIEEQDEIIEGFHKIWFNIRLRGGMSSYKFSDQKKEEEIRQRCLVPYDPNSKFYVDTRSNRSLEVEGKKYVGW